MSHDQDVKQVAHIFIERDHLSKRVRRTLHVLRVSGAVETDYVVDRLLELNDSVNHWLGLPTSTFKTVIQQKVEMILLGVL